MPAALTWYYTVSNVITLLIQFVIQTYIIDHQKILAKLQENKKKPTTEKKTSGFQKRMEDYMRQQQTAKTKGTGSAKSIEEGSGSKKKSK